MTARSTIARIPAEMLASSPRSSVVTIGNFDGVHTGHLHVVRHTVERARALGLRSIALTFEPHPVTFFRGVDPDTLRLTTAMERERLLRDAGIDDVLTLAFDAQTASITADDFVDQLLVEALGAAEVHVGWDFRFGRDRRGDVQFLEERLRRDGAAACAHGAYVLDLEPVSSTRVRRALSAGDVATAARLLGRWPSWSGTSAHGAGRGRGVGIPTVNLYPRGRMLPLFGVYATRISVAGECFDSITNIGTRPTFENDGKPSIETMILETVDADLHDLPVEVELRGFIRAERRFDGADALREQIGRDVAAARAILDQTRT